MVKRHVELRLHLLVAAITESWLGLDQQELICHSLVGRMTTQAAQVVLAVRGARKVHVIFPGTVAFQTTLVDLFRRCCLEAENLLGIGVFHVSSTRPVAGFTTMPLKSLFRLEDRVPVSCALKSFENILVTSHAGVRSHIFRCNGILPSCALRRLIGRSAHACTGGDEKD